MALHGFSELSSATDPLTGQVFYTISAETTERWTKRINMHLGTLGKDREKKYLFGKREQERREGEGQEEGEEREKKNN